MTDEIKEFFKKNEMSQIDRFRVANGIRPKSEIFAHLSVDLLLTALIQDRI